jgi:citrate synthase
VFESFPCGAEQMAALTAMINTASCFDADVAAADGDKFDEAAARLISKTRTIGAYIYRMANRLPFVEPDPNLPYVANFLRMMFSTPG